MAQFFINRPIFAWVIAIIIMLAGAMSIKTLPLEQYPNIAPPRVSISANYTGASAKTVEDSVTQVIEQQLKGLDNLIYMGSTSDASGSSRTTLTFNAGTNIDVAQVQVQNKLQQAMSRLPPAVQSRGVTVTKGGNDYLMIITFTSPDPSVSQVDIGDYISSNLVDVISRIDGVGDVLTLGTGYAMRVWLDPGKLEKYALMPSDIGSAINAQNAQVSAGQLGALPAVGEQQLNATITARSKLQTKEEFEQIVLKSTTDGAAVRLKDVARIELGAENLTITSRLNGQPGASMGVVLSDSANAMAVATAVNAKIAELQPFFPYQLKPFTSYDTTPFVSASIEEVVKALLEAMVLVVLVMYIFLQNFRATLIPAIAVPVVLLGTFGVLSAAGYSINTLTMFGMVLAIGLLVDDAIVVVENVERVMAEEGLSPLEATRKSMGQIQGALVGIGLVLSAVFVPMAFFGGSAGIIYKQFSITIVAAMGLSVLVAMIFTPALCATMLKPIKGGHQEKKGFFGWFNRKFDNGTQRYTRGVGGMLRRRGRYMLIFLLIVGGMAVLFSRLPTAFLPDEDQSTMFVQVQLPSNASAQRTWDVLEEVNDYLTLEEGDVVDAVMMVNGFNFAGRGQNSGMAFVRLKPWEERTGDVTDAFSLAERASARFAQIKDANVFAFIPPAIPEMGNATGFNFYLQDNAGIGHEALMGARNQLLELAAQEPSLMMVRPNGLDDEPQYHIIIDDEKASAHKVSLNDVNQTMSAAWGSMYVNDFIDRGRVKRVYIQGALDSRISPEDFGKWYVRNAEGEMVPFSAFATGEWIYGSPKLQRYNGVPAIEILGQPAPGYSTGDAMQTIAGIMEKLPAGVGISYTGLSYEELQTGDQAPMLYALTILIVFLCLAALYESWSVPAAVMLVVPLGVIGSVIATLGRGLSNDVFFQIGLLTTIGLSAKNAILIVEFAKDLYEKEGRSLIEAAMEAARLRLRPIVMTSLAFTFGVLPMALASGAGAGSQHSIATGVVGGMITATILAIFFVPLFYVVVVKLFSRKPKPEAAEGETA